VLDVRPTRVVWAATGVVLIAVGLLLISSVVGETPILFGSNTKWIGGGLLGAGIGALLNMLRSPTKT